MYSREAKGTEGLGLDTMNDKTNPPRDTDERTETDFYLPAVAVSPGLDKFAAVVGDLFDTHGVVLIPTTYNK